MLHKYHKKYAGKQVSDDKRRAGKHITSPKGGKKLRKANGGWLHVVHDWLYRQRLLSDWLE